MNVLILYNETQTYTATVFEHICSFRRFSRHRCFFAHQDQYNKLGINFAHFDAIVVHFSIRLPFDQIAPENAEALRSFGGLKVLFIQDEYDHTHRAWHWIQYLGIGLVFTVVPQANISRIYPTGEFPHVQFVNVLTGYVPAEIPTGSFVPPSHRNLIVGYRGRPLPLRYGGLGREKVEIGKIVADYCRSNAIAHDIAWTEQARIYGPMWYQFMSSCRAMIGSESGCNVFDWDGQLTAKVEAYAKENPSSNESEIYAALIEPFETPGLMNQISPRVFESIATHTVLVLFEGAYSNVVQPGKHFIPLKKDGSNLDDVFRQLTDAKLVDAMANDAYRDLIESGKYSYSAFVTLCDDQIENAFQEHCRRRREPATCVTQVSIQIEQSPLTTTPVRATLPQQAGAAFGVVGNIEMQRPISVADISAPTQITSSPIRALPPQPSTDTLAHTLAGALGARDLAKRLAIYVWWKLPSSVRTIVRPTLKRLLGKGS